VSCGAFLLVAIGQAREARAGRRTTVGAVIVNGHVHHRRTEPGRVPPDPTAQRGMAVPHAARQWACPPSRRHVKPGSSPDDVRAAIPRGRCHGMVIGGPGEPSARSAGGLPGRAMLEMLGRDGRLAVDTLALPEIDESLRPDSLALWFARDAEAALSRPR